MVSRTVSRRFAVRDGILPPGVERREPLPRPGEIALQLLAVDGGEEPLEVGLPGEQPQVDPQQAVDVLQLQVGDAERLVAGIADREAAQPGAQVAEALVAGAIRGRERREEGGGGPVGGSSPAPPDAALDATARF